MNNLFCFIGWHSWKKLDYFSDGETVCTSCQNQSYECRRCQVMECKSGCANDYASKVKETNK